MSEERKIEVQKNKVIGKGGFSIVFEGKFGAKQVAVKRVVKLSSDVTDRELEALQRLKHPNIVELLCVEHDDDFQ